MIILNNCTINVNIHNAEAGIFHEFTPPQPEKLNDVINGKRQPWRGKKVKTMRLAKAFTKLEGGKSKRAGRIWHCGTDLGFEECPESGKKRLRTAHFCRERLCAMCNWRRSIKTFYQVSRVMDVAQEERPDTQAIFLTLTVRNCSGAELPGVLDNMFDGWYHLTKHRKFKNNVVGWFRALEVTYNRDTGEYHPHFHAILLVDGNYAKPGGSYISTADWVHLWRVSARLDYDPVCDVRRVKNTSERKYKAVAEVAKYTMKDSDYLFKDEEKTAEVVGDLSVALKGRRLFAFGGLLKEIAKRLKADKPDEGDLVHISEDDKIREDVYEKLIFYAWDFGLKEYYRTEYKLPFGVPQ